MQRCANLVEIENMLKNAYYYLVGKIGFGAAENEPAKKSQNLANNLLILIPAYC